MSSAVNTLDRLLWEENDVVFETPYYVELTLQPHDSMTHSKQVASLVIPSSNFNFSAHNTPRAIFTNFPTFYKRCAALQLPKRTNCKLSVLVADAAKSEFSVEGSFNDFLNFSVTVLF